MTLTFDTHVASFSSMHLLNFEIIGGNSYRKNDNLHFLQYKSLSDQI